MNYFGQNEQPIFYGFQSWELLFMRIVYEFRFFLLYNIIIDYHRGKSDGWLFWEMYKRQDVWGDESCL